MEENNGKFYRLNDIIILVGRDLIDYAISVFESIDVTERWFNSPIPSLGYKKPYEICKENKSQVYDVLGKIEYGVYS